MQFNVSESRANIKPYRACLCLRFCLSRTKIDLLAHRVGLNVEALTLGFHHLVGQPINDYRMRNRMQSAAAMLRKDPTSKLSVIAKSGFTEPQFEAAFIQHIGVISHQYEQIH